MRLRDAVVLFSFACVCAAGPAFGADSAPWAGAADESGDSADPNAGSRGAPLPRKSAPTVTVVQPSQTERVRKRSAASGGSAASGSDTVPSRASHESSRSNVQTSSNREEATGWRGRDWGWLGLLGLFGLFGLLGRRRRPKRDADYPEVTDAHTTRDAQVRPPDLRGRRQVS